LGIFLACLSVYAWNVARAWPLTIDDAFIIFRYAQNIADGHGPNFNPGADRTEGVTQFLWMFLLSVPALFGLSITATAKVLGVVFLAGVLGLVCNLDRDKPGPGPVFAAALACAFLATLPSTAVHAVSGMETAIYTLQITLHFILCRRAMTTTETSVVVLPISGLLLGLQRPEGNVVAVVSIVTILWLMPNKRLLRSSILYYVLPGALYFVARWMYYGHLLPLPIYIKMFIPPELDDPSLAGTSQAMGFLRIWGIWLALPFLLGLTRLTKQWLPATLATIAFLAACLVPAHIMGIEWRYFFPVLPMLVVIAGLGVDRLYSLLLRARVPTILSASIVIAVCAAPVVFNLTLRQSQLAGHLLYAEGLGKAHIALGERLSVFALRSEILVIGDTGAVPFYSGWETRDSFGLNNPRIATTGIRDPQRMLAGDPGLVVLISRGPTTFDSPLPWEKGLHQACLDSGYERAKVLEFSPSYYLWLFAKRSTPLFDWLEAWQVR
jgi:hypothetical protein